MSAEKVRPKGAHQKKAAEFALTLPVGKPTLVVSDFLGKNNIQVGERVAAIPGTLQEAG
jgi:hypothetical protein